MHQIRINRCKSDNEEIGVAAHTRTLSPCVGGTEWPASSATREAENVLPVSMKAHVCLASAARTAALMQSWWQTRVVSINARECTRSIQTHTHTQTHTVSIFVVQTYLRLSSSTWTHQFDQFRVEYTALKKRIDSTLEDCVPVSHVPMLVHVGARAAIEAYNIRIRTCGEHYRRCR
jgi:hypothetical protein